MDDLLQDLKFLHAQLATRDCASTTLIKSMAHLGKPFEESVAAAMLTLGGLHAPITQTQRLWKTSPSQWHSYLDTWAEDMLPHGPFRHKIPGWGSAWYKAEPDPLLQDFESLLPAEVVDRLAERTTDVQLCTGKVIFPNAASYTAIVADMLGFTPETAPVLVVMGRALAWAHIYEAALGLRSE